MDKKQLFYLFYIFCSFTLLVCGEKNILPNLTNSQEPEPEPLKKPAPQPWLNVFFLNGNIFVNSSIEGMLLYVLSILDVLQLFASTDRENI